jgi:transcriptional regulator GlxA family with amidase domain
VSIRLHVLALPGAMDSALGTVLDVANTANRLSTQAGRRPVFDVRPVAASASALSLASGLRLSGLQRLEPCGKRDVLVLPGANHATPADVLRWLATPAVRKAVAWVAAAHGAGATVYAGCVGTFVAAESGILAGARATTTWWLAPTFSQRYPTVQLEPRRVLVDAGTVTTAGAAFAHADLMLALVQRCVSAELARLCARYLLLDTRRVQAGYPLLGRVVREDSFAARAERWALAHLATAFTAEHWAEALHVSTRTLARRIRVATGLTPLQFVQRLRVDRALHLLESSAAPVETVAAQVGYADATALRRLTQRALGSNPRELRRQSRPLP